MSLGLPVNFSRLPEKLFTCRLFEGFRIGAKNVVQLLRGKLVQIGRTHRRSGGGRAMREIIAGISAAAAAAFN